MANPGGAPQRQRQEETQGAEAPPREAAEPGGEDARPEPAYVAVVPATDILETPEALLVIADMPGTDETTVSVTLEDRVLTLSGKTVPEAFEGYVLEHVEEEVRPWEYRRTFQLADAIDREGIEASVRNGVLRLRLPKSREARVRKIAVKGK